ncbi:MAG: hypothetical protein SFW67_32455 [Myxococcaceae bacterium]|nr:hypothetical protein [Myxococcaceae bacterium]
MASQKAKKENELGPLLAVKQQVKDLPPAALSVLDVRQHVETHRVEYERVAKEVADRIVARSLNEPEFDERIKQLARAVRDELSQVRLTRKDCADLNAVLREAARSSPSPEVLRERLGEELRQISNTHYLCGIALEDRLPNAVVFLSLYYFGDRKDRSTDWLSTSAQWAQLSIFETYPLREHADNIALSAAPIDLRRQAEWKGCSGYIDMDRWGAEATPGFERGSFHFMFAPQWSNKPGEHTDCAYLGSKPRIRKLRVWGPKAREVVEPAPGSGWISVAFSENGSAVATLGLPTGESVRAVVPASAISWKQGEFVPVEVQWNAGALNREKILTLNVGGAQGSTDTTSADEGELVVPDTNRARR